MAAGMKIYETKGDDWANLAKDYESMAASTSSPSMDAMLHVANEIWPFSKATAILDNGCGPGPVTKRLLRDYGSELPSNCGILCSDFADGMIAAADENRRQGGREWERVQTVVQNAMELTSVEDSSKTHVLAGFVYFMTSDPQKCLTESLRVLQPGGACVTSSWSAVQWMDIMLLVKQIRPEKAMPSVPEAWTSTHGVKAEFERAGFRDAGAKEVVAEMRVESAEALIELFLTKMPHVVAMKADMSEEEIAKLRKLMVSETERISGGQGGKLTGVGIVGWGRK